MPKQDAHLQYQKWAQEYGPIYSLMLGTKTLIVLSSEETVTELLDKRSAITSDRMDMYVGQTLVSGGHRMLALRYGPTWRTQRKLAHNLLNISAARTYTPYQTLESTQLLHDLLSTPTSFLTHIRRYSNSLTTSLVFGFRTPSPLDPNLHALFTVVHRFVILAQTSTSALLDCFPVLRALPAFLIPIKREALAAHEVERPLFLNHYLTAKKAIANHTARPCFCLSLARTQIKEGLSDIAAAYVSATMLEAGSETTANVLYGFVQAMILYPEVQQKAQAELDRVIGDARLPVMEDEADLPYMRACVKESLRWMPTAILGGVPHASIREDSYMGYRIPKGAGLVNNVWTIHRDAARYKDPERFEPERYMDKEGEGEGKGRDHFAFGAGRRVCVGQHVAERSLFLGISRLMWAFDVKPAVDGEGREVLPVQDRLTQGFVAQPEEFEARIVVRGKERKALVVKEWEEVKGRDLDADEQWRCMPEGMHFKGEEDV